MGKLTSPLDNLNIAAPCPANWDEMFSFQGDRVRYCSQCKLNVYNLSDMTQGDAEALILRTEGRLCVRMYRRADGTILTKNCPVGMAAIKARMSRVTQLALGMLVGLFANIGFWSLKDTLLPRPHHSVMGAIALSKEDIESIQPLTSDDLIMGRVIRPEDEKRIRQELKKLVLPQAKQKAKRHR